MGKMKDHALAIEELCFEAHARGADTPQAHYLYVRDRMQHVTFDQVYGVLCSWRFGK